ncbi:MAG: serine hydrolase domain-containing protein [Bacteroidales bacterium]
MKNRLKLALVGLLLINSWANAQSVEAQFQALIDSVFIRNPSSVGILVHVESPGKGISWSGASGYPYKDAKTKLEPDQPALIASSMKPYVSATILRLQELGKLTIEDPICNWLTEETITLFESDGYDLNLIRIKHLLSHTSGIEGYLNYEFFDWVTRNPNFSWTRNGLLQQAVKMGDPLGKPEDVFRYQDANYLLCTEIIEGVTNKPFYEAMRELLRYDEFGFTDTWFPTLEAKGENTKTLIHQYRGEMGWDSYNIDISWDLYGGGGIASTTKETAQFFYKLFTGKIIEDQNTFNQIFTQINTKDGGGEDYLLGVMEGSVRGYKSYGHRGFWGTDVLYLPEIKSSIAVFISERDNLELRHEITDRIIEILNK